MLQREPYEYNTWLAATTRALNIQINSIEPNTTALTALAWKVGDNRHLCN